jgi:DNA modification methylase
MAKTLDDLAKSREARESILAHYGGELPQSVMRADFSTMAIDETQGQNELSRLPNSTAFRMSGISVREGKSGGGMSRFPQNVGRKLVLFYSKENDWVLDPFMGHNSRCELVLRAKRNYLGNDISFSFVEATKRAVELVKAELSSDLFAGEFQQTAELACGDSRALPWETGCGDFTITSPPYYNLENYGDEPEQLGLGARSYSHFLDRLQEVCCENWRVLKPGRFAVWCVNDFRLDGKFHSYHSDVIRLMQRAAFVQHDIAIIDFGTTIRAAFAAQAVEQKILPKRHEYALVFQKPR